MTKTDWTSADYWEASKRLAIGDILLPVSQVRSMLDFAADRIEADESAVPVAYSIRWASDSRLNLSTVFDTEQEAHEWVEKCSGDGEVVPLFTHPPAQPAQMDKCCCGEPSVSGVRHRSDGPCHLSDAEGTQAQEQPGWKWVPVEPTAAMVVAFWEPDMELGHDGYLQPVEIYKAMLASAPTPPKDK